MKKYQILKPVIGASVAAATIFWTTCFAENPVVQTCFTADPAPMVYKDTVYLYTSHDEDDATGFKMLDWKCFSTKDMVNWTDHGSIASLKTFSWANNNAWAPQCIERDGKFYLYCPVGRSGGRPMAIGVAVSDSPFGPFTDPLKKPLVEGSYDPTVFIDEDGQAYLYWGGNGPCYYVKLNKDMISVAGDIHVASIDFTGTPREASYTEGPWLWREKDHYYLSWASRCCPEGIGYGMSDSPTGPWKCKGTIMDPNPLSSGNHPGILDFKGKSYVFGFNYTLNWEQTDVHRERRSVCVAEMSYNADGTIQKVPWWTPEGVPQVGTFNPFAQVDAATICYERGIRAKPRGSEKEGMCVTATENGAYIKIKGVDFGNKGATNFLASLATETNGASIPSRRGSESGPSITLRLDSETGTAIGTLRVRATDGLDKWETQSCKITGARGVHDLYLKFFGKGAPLMSFDWWKFE